MDGDPTAEEWTELRSLWWGLFVVRRAALYAGWCVLLILALGALIMAVWHDPFAESGVAVRGAVQGGLVVLTASSVAVLWLRGRMDEAMRAGGPAIRRVLRRMLWASLPQLLGAAGFGAIAVAAGEHVGAVYPAFIAMACATIPAVAVWVMIRHRPTLEGVLYEPFAEGSPAAARWDRWCGDLDKRLREIFDESRKEAVRETGAEE